MILLMCNFEKLLILKLAGLEEESLLKMTLRGLLGLEDRKSRDLILEGDVHFINYLAKLSF